MGVGWRCLNKFYYFKVGDPIEEIEAMEIPDYPETQLVSIALLDHYVAFGYSKSRSSKILIKPLL